MQPGSTRARLGIGAVCAFGGIALGAAACRRLRLHTKRRSSREAKAAEDRHIGFRWLRRAARLETEADAERVFCVVAAELASRLGAGAAGHVVAHLPLGLRTLWEEEARPAGRAERLDRAELVERIRSRLGLAREEDAELLLVIVMGWLEHLAPEETADVDELLPPDLCELWRRARLPQVPPWHTLHLPARDARDRPLRPRIVLEEPGREEPTEVDDEEAFDLPPEGAPYWRGPVPYRVRRVKRGERPVLHLRRDLTREAQCYEDLPTGFAVVARQRPEDGLWVSKVLDADGEVVGWWEGEDCDAVVDEARAIALRSLSLAGGYHPERE